MAVESKISGYPRAASRDEDRKVLFVDQVDLASKRVFVRVDFDVPLNAEGLVEDDTLIRAALPTLRCVLDGGGKLVVASHLGPCSTPDTATSLEPAAAVLAGLLDKEVRLSDDCVGDGVRKLILDMRAGDVVMLENLHRYPEEKANSVELARSLAALCDVYVNDAFGAAHLTLASTVAMVPLVAGPKCAGLLLKKEMEFLSARLRTAVRPFAVMLGGRALSERLTTLESLIPRVDVLMLGGAMVYTLLRARGVDVGASSFEDAKVDAARQILERAKKLGVSVMLPKDHFCTDGTGRKSLLINEPSIPEPWIGTDLGPKTVAEYRSVMLRARTVFWHGSMSASQGIGDGTRALAQALGEFRGLSVVGGGESAQAIRQLGLSESVSHVSSGSVASLALAEGHELPGIKALTT